MRRLNRFSRRNKLVSGGIAGLAGLAMAAGPAAMSAQADVRCGGEAITINSNAGDEPPSTETGHEHQSGNHYIVSISSTGLVTWYADGNGGFDGDQPDAYYGKLQC